MIDGQRLTITTGSLNRLEALKRTLATWIAHPEPDEIIIIDWSNKIPLRESLIEFTDPRIIIARAEGQKYWHHSRCHNLELQLATGERLLRLDNDCLLGTAFFKHHILEPGCFFSGYWQGIPTEEDDKRNLSGTLYIHKSNILAVNGYNERLPHYGHEDDDLYSRLIAGGLKHNNIDLSTVDHIPHSDFQRYENLEIANQLPHPSTAAPKQIRDKITSNVRLNLIRMNRTIAITSPWTNRDHMTDWRIDKISAAQYSCSEIPGNKTCSPLMYIDSISAATTIIPGPSSHHSPINDQSSDAQNCAEVMPSHSLKAPTFSADWAEQVRSSWAIHVFPLLNRQKPLNWLELGSFEGRSALWIVENMFLNPDSRVTCVDIWTTIPDYQGRGSYSYESVFDSNTSGMSQIIKHKGPTKEVLPTLPPASFHGCYIDASHEEEDVLTDAQLVLPLMLPNAIIVFDDYAWNEGSGVRTAVDHLLLHEWKHRAQLKHLGYQAVLQLSP